MVIIVILLVVAFGNKVSFVLGIITISDTFESEDPFVLDDIKIWLWRDKCPGSISNERIEFFGHGFFPLKVFHGLCNTCWFNQRRKGKFGG